MCEPCGEYGAAPSRQAVMEAAAGGPTLAVVASALTWRGMLRGSVLAVRLTSGYPPVAPPGIGSLSCAEQRRQRRTEGLGPGELDLLGRSRRSLGSVACAPSWRTHPPQRRTGVTGTTGGPWHRFRASAASAHRRARASRFRRLGRQQIAQIVVGRRGVLAAPFRPAASLPASELAAVRLGGLGSASGRAGFGCRLRGLGRGDARLGLAARRLVRQALADRREDLLQALGPQSDRACS